MTAEKKWKLLTEQIKKEHGWAKELMERNEKDKAPECKKIYDRGVLGTYKMIVDMINSLEEGKW